MSAAATRARIKTAPVQVAAARQRFEDERAQLSTASSVRYAAKADSVVVQMASGLQVVIPRRSIDELAGVPGSVLGKELTVTVGGDAISVPSADVDIAVAGLLRDLLGFDIQRAGGRARTEAKAAAARTNGAKGGRPRSSLGR